MPTPSLCSPHVAVVLESRHIRDSWLNCNRTLQHPTPPFPKKKISWKKKLQKLLKMLDLFNLVEIQFLKDFYSCYTKNKFLVLFSVLFLNPPPLLLFTSLSHLVYSLWRELIIHQFYIQFTLLIWVSSQYLQIISTIIERSPWYYLA